MRVDKFLQKLGLARGANQLLTIASMRDSIISALKVAAPDAFVAAIDERTFQFGLSADSLSTASVTNVYAEYCDDPSRRDYFVNQMVASTVELLNGALDVETLDHLVIVARDNENSAGLVTRRLAGNVGLMLAVDLPNSLAYVTPDGLRELGLTEDEAFALAMTTLEQRIGPLVKGDLFDGHVYFVGADSSLGTGALAIPQMWGGADTRRVVFIDTRWMFFWAYSNDSKAVDLLRRYARERIKTSETVATSLIEFDGAQWRDIGL